MAAMEGIKTSKVSPRFLHGNSTSHTWPFSAIAELIDNAYDPDVNASELWIDKRTINKIDCLNFVDNGNGMDSAKLYKMLSFGYNDKVQVGDLKPIGYYGNGFKSGSMRLGKDAMVFTRCMESISVGFLSQSYLEAIGADAVIVPIVTWSLPTKLRVVSSDSDKNLRAILKYSIFSTEQALLHELSTLEKCRTGTNIIIYNLKTDKMGKYELDFDSDLLDFRNPETHVVDLTTLNRPIHAASPEYRRSLREYCSILYLKPRMKIILRGKKVSTKIVSKCLSRTETDVYKPTWLKKPVKIVFGFTSSQEPESYGLMMYYKNRLIKAFEKVGVQKQANDQGVGVVGVVETDFLEPIHIKQDFNRTEKYSAFMQNVAIKLNEYYQEKTFGKTPETQMQAVQLPDWTWAQCDNCLKWRRLPTGYCDRLPEKWYCKLNPDAAFNRCDIEEEPEDDDEALQASYTKTVKKKKEEEKRQTKAEEERKILEREQQLRKQQKMIEEQKRELKKHQELEVTSSQDRNKPTVGDFEQAKTKLDVMQRKMKEQESTIEHLNNQKHVLEKQKRQLLDLAESVKLSSSQNRLLVDNIVGTSSSTVTSSSTSGTRKRKGDDTQGSGGKMLIKTEDGEMVEVTQMDQEENNIVDLTLDDEDDSSNDNENQNNNAEVDDEKETGETESKTRDKLDDHKDSVNDIKTSSGASVGEQLDIKPDKALLDKKIKSAENTVNKGSQTVPVVMKLATLKESEILKLSQVEKNTMLVSKSRELEEAKSNLSSLQENIYRLLKIIVPDYDYGEPENVEKVILEFIRVNEEESQEASGS